MMGQTKNGKIKKCENQLWEYYQSSTRTEGAVKQVQEAPGGLYQLKK